MSARPRIAVVGHVEWVDFVLVPRLPRSGEVLHATGSFARAAGGGGVAAVALAEHGAEVDFFCALGRDEDGHAAAEELAGRGVRVHVAWHDQPTRRALTFLHGAGERTIVTVGERLEPRGADPLPWERLARVKAVYFTAGDRAALRHARSAPVLVASPRARDALEGLDGAAPPIDALVFSASDRDECEWARWAAPRAGLLVATEGAKGGRWWTARSGATEEGRWQPVRPPGPVRDSYGCGDSFAAGFTFALGTGDPVARAAALGAQWGAWNLTRAGAP